MSTSSPLLEGLLDSKWRVYEKHVTEVKIKQSAITCCLCCQPSSLETDEHSSLKSVICKCMHPLCADCTVASDVFSNLNGLRHCIHPRDRFKYSYGFYCDGCGASNKLTPELQPKNKTASTSESSRRVRLRPNDKEYHVDFTWKKCRWCEQRCHTKCFLYRIKPWQQTDSPIKSPKRVRQEYDAHTRNVKARAAKGVPSSPLALFASNAADPPFDGDFHLDSQNTVHSPTPEEIETLKYGMGTE